MTDPQTAIDAPVRVVLRPIATPLPIGMLALAVGSLVLTGVQLGWIPTAQSSTIALCLLGFVVPLQFVGFVFALLSRDEGVASSLAVLTGTWLASALSLLATPPGATSDALGLLLVAAAGALLVPVAVAAPTKPLISATILLAAIRFVVTGCYEFGGGSSWKTAAGIAGLVVTAFAWYSAAAFALEAGRRRRVLPTLRRLGHAGPSPYSTPDPIGPAAHDAGARSQL
jgi:succinate-acetate transporter protein